jgi:hypothetical protein
MSAKGITYSATQAEKEEVCRSCNRRSNLLKKTFKFEDRKLEDLLPQEELDLIEVLMGNVDRSNWYKFVFNEAPLGKMAFYDFSLAHKLNSVEIPINLWSEYLSNLRSSLRTYFAVRNLIRSSEARLLVTYNGMYATNNTAAFAARQFGLKTWSLHAGQHLSERYGTICAYESQTLPVFSYEKQEWKTSINKEIHPDAASRVTEHLLQLFRASNRFVYSAPSGFTDLEDIKKVLSISSDKKILLATMSSADEIFAASLAGLLKESDVKPLFADSNEWIQFLISEIGARPDLHLIIRVHPREFPNKRETVLAPSVKKLKETLKDLPPNVTVNWPDQNVSLYDLAHLVDVVLNSSSSAGLELSALGIPVVLYQVQHMLAYDASIHRPVEGRENYMKRVDEALKTGWSIDNTRMAFRWWGFLFSRVAIDITEGFKYPAAGYISSSPSSTSKFRNEVLKFGVKYGPLIQERIHLYKRQRLKIGKDLDFAIDSDAQILIGPESGEDALNVREDEILANEIRKLLDTLGTPLPSGSQLIQHMEDYVSRFNLVVNREESF